MHSQTRLVPIIRHPATEAGPHAGVTHPRTNLAGHVHVCPPPRESWPPHKWPVQAAMACSQADVQACADRAAPVIVVADEDSDGKVNADKAEVLTKGKTGQSVTCEDEEGVRTDDGDDDGGSIRDWAEFEAELEAELGYKQQPRQRTGPTVQTMPWSNSETAAGHAIVGAQGAQTSMGVPPVLPGHEQQPQQRKGPTAEATPRTRRDATTEHSDICARHSNAPIVAVPSVLSPCVQQPWQHHGHTTEAMPRKRSDPPAKHSVVRATQSNTPTFLAHAPSRYVRQPWQRDRCAAQATPQTLSEAAAGHAAVGAADPTIPIAAPLLLTRHEQQSWQRSGPAAKVTPPTLGDALPGHAVVGAPRVTIPMVAPPARSKASMFPDKSSVSGRFEGSSLRGASSVSRASTISPHTDAVPTIKSLTSDVTQLHTTLDVAWQRDTLTDQGATMVAHADASKCHVKVLGASTHVRAPVVERTLVRGCHDDDDAWEKTKSDRTQAPVTAATGARASDAANVNDATANAEMITADAQDAQLRVESKVERGLTSSDEHAGPSTKRAKLSNTVLTPTKRTTPTPILTKVSKPLSVSGDFDVQIAEHYTELHLNDTLLEFKNRAPEPIIRSLGEADEVMVCCFPGCAKTWKDNEAFTAYVVKERAGKSFRDYEWHYVVVHILNNERRVMTEDMCLPTIGRHRTVAVCAPCDDCGIEQTQVIEYNDNNVYRRVCAACFRHSGARICRVGARRPQHTHPPVSPDEKRLPAKASDSPPQTKFYIPDKHESNRSSTVSEPLPNSNSEQAMNLNAAAEDTACESEQLQRDDAPSMSTHKRHSVTRHENEPVKANHSTLQAEYDASKNEAVEDDALVAVDKEARWSDHAALEDDAVKNDAVGEEDDSVVTVNDTASAEDEAALAAEEEDWAAELDWMRWWKQDGQSDVGVHGGQRRSAGDSATRQIRERGHSAHQSGHDERRKPLAVTINNSDIVDISSDDMDNEGACEDDACLDEEGKDTVPESDTTQPMIELGDVDGWWTDSDDGDDGDANTQEQVEDEVVRTTENVKADEGDMDAQDEGDDYEQVSSWETVKSDGASSCGANVSSQERNTVARIHNTYTNIGSRHRCRRRAWGLTRPRIRATRHDTRKRRHWHTWHVNAGKKRRNRNWRMRRGKGVHIADETSRRVPAEDDVESHARTRARDPATKVDMERIKQDPGEYVSEGDEF